ncbi:IclR family transcriptional regulator [Pseudoroseomonas wenyumeiae]|uniref:IclR family transcriptional regulator n=1 Tax=Teichococcus wenyumeiae TaxID=2478470 RepID=A0A3A9JKC0_9PROT|nr:IclR family transcriptional regulator [Pseudoroseomonas wenyumeiae]RMI19897.1 IclR family transcriptional regulator [Pseudoroseomonas wenyumeiae]
MGDARKVHIVDGGAGASRRPTSGAQSSERVIALLKLVAGQSTAGIGLAELVEASGLNRPTARRLLLALMRGGLVEQDAHSRRYHLGPESYVLGTLAADRFGIHRLAMDGLARLAQASGDSAFLCVRREMFTVCLHREEGSFPIRTHVLAAGMRHPLGVGGAGLALLAALPDPEVEAALEANAGLLATSYPQHRPERLRALVAECRMRGFAINPGLVVSHSWGMGLAVRDAAGEPVAALSLAAIESRMGPDRQPELAALLREEVTRLEAKLKNAGRLRAERPVARKTSGRKMA